MCPLEPTAPCGLAEALLGARTAGALSPEGERQLLRHLEICAECFRLARELDASAVADALSGAAQDERDLADLMVVSAEHYVLGEEIGRGGMGRIVRARDRRLGRAVAIKELIDEGLRARFEAEARLTARLQHPSIVSVHEAGRWPNGSPFYAMKYVAGLPLSEVVLGMHTLGERLALLPNLLAVADAIAYAHSQRIVHRDLKPANILVGAFGETVVIDWGLAKDLSAPAVAGGPFRGGAGDLTDGGAGTPAYMPPEQARGEDPDERVDVYALGATLHHVLAGDRPDRRRLPDETPRDLRDIVAKAMAREKDERYPTAAELAAELRRFQNGQLVSAHRYTLGELVRRWLRRHRGIALVALASFVLLGVAGAASIGRIVAERDRADAERDRARQLALEASVARAAEATRRAAAEDLVDFMLKKLRERLEPVGRLDLVGELGEHVLHYYDTVGAAGDAATRLQRATAYDIMTEAAYGKGDIVQALAARQKGLALLEALVRERPTDDEVVARLARALSSIGDLYDEVADRDAALASYRRALALATDVSRARPTDPIAVARVAMLELRLGRIADKTGAPAVALTADVAARTRLAEYAIAHPESDAIRGYLASADFEIAEHHRQRRELGLAVAAFRRALTLRQELVDKEPQDTRRWAALGETHHRLAVALLNRGDEAAAMAEHEESLRIHARLAEREPANQEWQVKMAESLWGQCSVHRRAWRFADARVACARAVAVAESLAARTSSARRNQEVLEQALERVVEVELDAGQETAALAAARRRVAIIESMLASKPGDPKFEKGSLVAHDRLALALERRDPAAAAASMSIAQELARARLEHDRVNRQLQVDLAEVLLDAADVALAGGRIQAAQDMNQEAMASLPGLALALPGDPDVSLLVGRAHLQKGDVAARKTGTTDAAPEWRSAYRLLAPLARRHLLSPALSARVQQLDRTASR